MEAVRVIAVLCALVSVGLAQNATDPQPQMPMFDMGAATGAAQVVAGIHAQEAMSNKYASLILGFQEAMSLGQAAQGMLASSVAEAKAEGNTKSLEEEAGFGGLFANSKELSDDELDKIELQTEHSLMFYTKLMFVQSAKKLSTAQRDHYQSKIQMMMLQGLGQYPVVSQFLYIMYYRDILQTFNSAVGIQRQDAWNFWLFLDMMETVEFDNGRSITDSFALKLSTAKARAHSLYLAQASIEMQTLYIDYYMNMLVTRAFGAPTGNVFLEEEAELEAEPSKPFSPFMMMFSHPGYMAYYMHTLKFYRTYLNFMAASSLNSACMLELNALTNADSNAPDMVRNLNLHGSLALSQWAQIRYMELYFEYITMFMGGAAPQGQPAAFNNLVQTEEAVASAPAPEPAAAVEPVTHLQEAQPALVPVPVPVPAVEAAAEQDPVQPAAQPTAAQPDVPHSVVG